MAVQPETRLVNSIRAAIREKYPQAWVFKVAGGLYQSAGVPDLLVVIDGHLFGMEVKYPRPGESRRATIRRVTLRQRAELHALARAGASVEVITSVEEALALIAKRFPDRAWLGEESTF